MAAISRRRLAATTLRLLRDEPTRRAAILRSLAAYLVVSKQTKQLDLFMKDIARELEISEKTVVAEVKTAFALTASTRKQLQTYIQKATNARAVELEESVDSTLLSGVVIRTADKELDTSARRALKQLASLNSGGNT